MLDTSPPGGHSGHVVSQADDKDKQSLKIKAWKPRMENVPLNDAGKELQGQTGFPDEVVNEYNSPDGGKQGDYSVPQHCDARRSLDLTLTLWLHLLQYPLPVHALRNIFLRQPRRVEFDF